jgi:serine/threonine protein kinase
MLSTSAPPAVVDLINSLLEYDPSERITARKALSHAFFDDFNTESKG